MENIKKHFIKHAGFSLNGTLYKSMDVMPDIVKGNRKLERVVDHILECHRGSKTYPDVVDAIKNIVSSAKKFGNESMEVLHAKAKHMVPSEHPPKKIKAIDAFNSGLLNR